MKVKPKYRNTPTIYRGWRFDSKAEARRCMDLDNLIRAGVVRWYLRQPTFRLGVPENVYRADYLVLNADGSTHVEDVKGVETSKFRRDVRLWESYGPFDLHVIKGKQLTIIPAGLRSELP